MADYKKLKAHYAEMKAFWNEGEEILNIVADKDKILKDIEVSVKKKVSELESINDLIDSSETRKEKLAKEVKDKEGKIEALDSYLAGGFKAQEAEMERDVKIHIAKLKKDGEAKLEELFNSISEAEATLIIKTKEADVKVKRVDALEKQLQDIKDGILA